MTDNSVMGRLKFAAAAVCVVMSACTSKPAGDGGDKEAIRQVVGKYVRSVDDADTALAREVWADVGDISFIHPLGHERGWIQIKTNVYEKIMRDMLSSRKLAIRDLNVKLYGNAAVVEFYWVFDAKWRKDGGILRTEGRETQVMRRGDLGKWELVHVHYSGMPVTRPGEGL
jgi:ketosteroid isomerase-like protein